MYYIGIDLGSTNTTVGLVDENGNIIEKKEKLTLADRGYNLIVKDIIEICYELFENNNIKTDDIISIGVGSPGASDTKNGVIIYSDNLKFKNVPLSSEIKKYLNVPVFLENNANCAAFGEYIAGAAKNHKYSITVTIGAGVGGGIIIDGKIYNGSNYMGTEIGHMSINADGEKCSCGRKGCWELYVSANAIIREAAITATKYPESKIFEAVNGDIKLINSKIPFDAYEAGDKYAKELIKRYVYYLSVGTANLINIFQPEIITFNGKMSAQSSKLIKPLINQVKNMVYGGALKTKIVITKLGNDAYIIGAAMLGKN